MKPTTLARRYQSGHDSRPSPNKKKPRASRTIALISETPSSQYPRQSMGIYIKNQEKYSHTNLLIVDLTRHEPAEMRSWNCAGRSPLKQRKDDATKKNGTETLSSTFRTREANGASIPYNGLT